MVVGAVRGIDEGTHFIFLWHDIVSWFGLHVVHDVTENGGLRLLVGVMFVLLVLLVRVFLVVVRVLAMVTVLVAREGADVHGLQHVGVHAVALHEVPTEQLGVLIILTLLAVVHLLVVHLLVVLLVLAGMTALVATLMTVLVTTLVTVLTTMLFVGVLVVHASKERVGESLHRVVHGRLHRAAVVHLRGFPVVMLDLALHLLGGALHDLLGGTLVDLLVVSDPAVGPMVGLVGAVVLLWVDKAVEHVAGDRLVQTE
jgi:hypothetical protein